MLTHIIMLIVIMLIATYKCDKLINKVRLQNLNHIYIHL